MRLENIEDELPGIQRIQASYRKARMQVEYDETQISEAQIIAAVKSKGYEAIPIG
jgi:copper chaperone CopZ